MDQLIYMMSHDYDTIDYSSIDNNVDNINKLKKEIYLLKYENNKLKNELQRKNNEDSLLSSYDDNFSKNEKYNLNNKKEIGRMTIIYDYK